MDVVIWLLFKGTIETLYFNVKREFRDGIALSFAE